MDSGFVTYRKSKGDDHPVSGGTEDGSDNNGVFISVYQHEVEYWRKLLKLGNNNKILVAFAWSFL